MQKVFTKCPRSFTSTSRSPVRRTRFSLLHCVGQYPYFRPTSSVTCLLFFFFFFFFFFFLRVCNHILVLIPGGMKRSASSDLDLNCVYFPFKATLTLKRTSLSRRLTEEFSLRRYMSRNKADAFVSSKSAGVELPAK